MLLAKACCEHGVPFVSFGRGMPLVMAIDAQCRLPREAANDEGLTGPQAA
ncbi:hypothetical protein [Caldimonas sp. KR1-144]